ncbi:MAG TPA: tRNA (adenosine(37)-N6)-threonylcarbamoyltransferase complex dimerization subunit type 1 TsaB [Steroidobacteraceae bacterium]|nr:tRNA (adenosine(37)-N6)-threonylcarbamoyltransferase complex dimerization subunit type 1 TsaB [Steroidobacteraceae bacterium]
MKLLALDTATEACSVALLVGETVLTRYEEPGRGHAELILPMVDAVLLEGGLKLRDLDCLAVGRGPGAFTGVRIAISIAQGLAFGAELKVVPVSDLAALAQRGVSDARTILACSDARMGEVYWAEFGVGKDGLVTAASPESLSRPEEVRVSVSGPWVAVGRGWAAYPQLAPRLNEGRDTSVTIHDSLLPRAQEIARLAVRGWHQGAGVPPEQALPVYLRDRVTHNLSQKT